MKSWKIGLALLLIIGITGVVFSTPIRIGVKNFTEQFLVGNLMAILLEDRGYEVELRMKTGMPSLVLREGIKSGKLDLCMDYTGTQWVTYTEHEYQNESPEELYEKVKAYDADLGLIWLNPIWCNKSYAIAVTNEFAEKNNVYTLSNFADYVNGKEGKVRISCDFEFFARPDGIPGLQEAYGFAFEPEYIATVLPGHTYQYLVEGKVTASMVFKTDPAVTKYDWVLLQDDKDFWPSYDLCPIVREEVLEANPGLAAVLNELVAAFPQDPAAAQAAMQALNAKVDIDWMELKDAALEWLQEKGLIE